MHKEIAKYIVDGYKRWFGKGPVKIKVHIDDCLLIVDMYGLLTPMEKTLLSISAEYESFVLKIRKDIADHVIRRFEAGLQEISQTKDLKIKRYNMENDFDCDRHVFLFFLNKSLV